jgi:hypothetical protein
MFDINQVKRNAMVDGVPLSEICLIYENLSEREIMLLEEHLLVAIKADTKVIGKFTESGDVFFPEKVVGAYSLGAN